MLHDLLYIPLHCIHLIPSYTDVVYATIAFVLFLLATVLSVLRFTAFPYTFGYFTLFLNITGEGSISEQIKTININVTDVL